MTSPGSPHPDPLFGPSTDPAPVMLAPMAGFTDAAMRQLSHEHGAALTFTEMVNAAGLVHDSQKTLYLLETLPDEGPVVAHLYGSDPQILGEAAARVEAMRRFRAIDLNCGCPVRKVVRKAAGVALMRTPERIGAIVKAMHAATSLPITVKTRLGLSPEEENVLEVGRAVQDNGGAMLAIHARYATQGHGGAVHLEALARVKQALSIPVVGNGGLKSPAGVRQMLNETGVDGVMIGRAAMGNPWIFTRIDADRAGTPWHAPSLDDIQSVLRRHLELECRLKQQLYTTYRPKSARLTPEEATVMHFRTHLHRYLQGMHGSSEARKRLNTMFTLIDVEQTVAEVIALEQAFRKRRASQADARAASDGAR